MSTPPENQAITKEYLPTELMIGDNYQNQKYGLYEEQVGIKFHRVYASVFGLVVENELDLPIVKEWLIALGNPTDYRGDPLQVDYEPRWFKELDIELAPINYSKMGPLHSEVLYHKR